MSLKSFFSCIFLLHFIFLQAQNSVKPVAHYSIDSADYFFQKGLQEKANGRKLESLKNFEKALKFDATNKAIYAEIGAVNMLMNRYTFARDAYKKMETLGDDSKEILKQLLTLSFQMRQRDDIINYATKLKKKDPSEKVSFYLGKINYDEDNYGEAIKQLDQATKEDPNNAEAFYLIGHSYADMMNYKQATSYYQKAIALDTVKTVWIYELGLIYYSINDHKNALKYILEAGEKGYKKTNDYLENLGIAYLNVGDLKNGTAIMSQVLERKPSDLNVLNVLAESYYYRQKYQDAMDYWDRILGYDKTNASALYMIGMCYQKKGEKDKGIALCDKAIEMDPSLASLKQKKQMMGL